MPTPEQPSNPEHPYQATTANPLETHRLHRFNPFKKAETEYRQGDELLATSREGKRSDGKIAGKRVLQVLDFGEDQLYLTKNPDQTFREAVHPTREQFIWSDASSEIEVAKVETNSKPFARTATIEYGGSEYSLEYPVTPNLKFTWDSKDATPVKKGNGEEVMNIEPRGGLSLAGERITPSGNMPLGAIAIIGSLYENFAEPKSSPGGFVPNGGGS